MDYEVPDFLHTWYQTNMIRFVYVLWHIKHCRLFKAKSSLYIYIKWIWFGWVEFYCISKIAVYLISNTLYTYILNVYDLVWLCFMACQPLWVIQWQILLIRISSSSLSCRVASTDIPDPLPSLLSIVHHLRLVFRATFRILT